MLRLDQGASPDEVPMNVQLEQALQAAVRAREAAVDAGDVASAVHAVDVAISSIQQALALLNGSSDVRLP